jgi:hypothetical protein
MTPLLRDLPDGAVPVTAWDGRSWFALAVSLTAIAVITYIHKTNPKED